VRVERDGLEEPWGRNSSSHCGKQEEKRKENKRRHVARQKQPFQRKRREGIEEGPEGYVVGMEGSSRSMLWPEKTKNRTLGSAAYAQQHNQSEKIESSKELEQWGCKREEKYLITNQRKRSGV